MKYIFLHNKYSIIKLFIILIKLRVLLSIPSSKNKEKPIYIPKSFLKNLDKIGEQTISYMEKVSQYKKIYESQSITPLDI